MLTFDDIIAINPDDLEKLVKTMPEKIENAVLHETGGDPDKIFQLMEQLQEKIHRISTYDSHGDGATMHEDGWRPRNFRELGDALMSGWASPEMIIAEDKQHRISAKETPEQNRRDKNKWLEAAIEIMWMLYRLLQNVLKRKGRGDMATKDYIDSTEYIAIVDRYTCHTCLEINHTKVPENHMMFKIIMPPLHKRLYKGRKIGRCRCRLLPLPTSRHSALKDPDEVLTMLMELKLKDLEITLIPERLYQHQLISWAKLHAFMRERY